MDILLLLFIFVTGSFVGSFLGVVVDRTNRKEKFILGRSHCESCKKTLKLIDLIPVISYVFLNGRCRYCKNKLSHFYPAIEILTGLLYVLSFSQIYSGLALSMHELLALFTLLYVMSVLIIIFFTDFKFGLIPFWAVATGLVAITIFHFLNVSGYEFSNYIFSAIGAFSFFFLIFLITKGRGMGFGDVVFVFMMGALLGFPEIILGLYIAFLVGAIFAVVLVILKIKKLRGDSLPFGPFLIIGTLIGFFWGEVFIEIAARYLLGV